MSSSWISPNANGSFPVVQTNALHNLALGNGTALRVCVTPIPNEGTLFSVVSSGRYGGAYVLNFAPNYSYVAEKFRLLEGDAICFARFIASQLNTEEHESGLRAAVARVVDARAGVSSPSLSA